MQDRALPQHAAPTALRTEIMPAFYQDSVVLMRIASQARSHPSVREVALFMGTPANHALLEQTGLATHDGRTAGPNDLIITVSAASDDAAGAAIDRVKSLLVESSRASAARSEFRPRSLESALRAMPDANLVSISVPGAYVKAEAMAALRCNLHVFIFSDNVPIEHEIELKQEAIRRGRFCMGPDQGTAYLGGVGLGFANLVSRGRIGCVAASGTGLQCVVSRIDALGEGISHAIGVGGRDLSEAVGGAMTLSALDALAQDAGTEAIVVISKPPHASVLARLEAKLERIEKPVVVCCVGAPPRSGASAAWVETLDQAGDAVVALLNGRRWQPRRFSDSERVAKQLSTFAPASAFEGTRIVGLYTGGTLAYETSSLLNAAFGGDHPHRIADLGDDRYTIGRPHPMIDPSARADMIVEACGDSQVGVVLLDVVLGNGAHDNPAESVATAVAEARRVAAGERRELAFIASVVGTARDRQGLAAQTELLEQAGIRVLATNADAARCAAMLATPRLQSRWMSKEL